MTTLVLGDSHSNLFADVPGVLHCRSPGAFTAQRFCDPEFQELWSWLAPWMESHRGSDTLVLSTSEIDIRAHFWRHIPRAVFQGRSLMEFITAKATELVTGILRVQQCYDIGRIIVWTAPPATSRTSYNPDWPFVGSVSTRNTLIHLFNIELERQISVIPTIKLATGFYDYIDPRSYLPRDHILGDGVHWHSSLRDQLWQQHIEPLLAGQSVDLGPAYHQMCQHSPSFVEEVSEPTWLYDTWVRTEDLGENLDSDPRAVILGKNYSRIYLRDPGRFPSSYRELALVNQ